MSDTTPLTDQDLADCARDCMARAAAVPEPSKVEEDARAALQRLVDDRSATVRGKHRDAVRALRRALAVDMAEGANRKGALPQALGLVSRVSKGTVTKHRAIVTMMHRLLEHSEWGPRTGDVIFPFRTVGAAAEAVTRGFFHAGIDGRLTAENVEQIWVRRFQAEKHREHPDAVGSTAVVE